jgi:CheY-like chemotaxis protein/HPt (histidine-containing phosphotransfer) domain-containing protein
LGRRHLRISVEDTGVGIAADDLETIFEPFAQGRLPEEGGRGGTWLGLDISRRLARFLGGDVSVKSEPGVGSTFTLELPLAKDVKIVSVSDAWLAAARESGRKPAPQAVDLRNLRILIVDDNPDNQAIIAFLLQEAGAAIDLANDGATGVQAVANAEEANTPYDMVLMDMRMPVMDGYAATAELRRRGCTTPIIALTAHAMVGDEQRCLRSGCDAYVSKPVVPDTLLTTIRQHVADADEGSPQLEDLSPARLTSTMIDNPRFAPLLRKYLDGLPGVILQLESARRAKDPEALRSIMHRLRGTAANYGFASVSEVTATCENLLRDANSLERIDRPLDELLDMLNAATVGAATDPVLARATRRDE